MLHSSSTWRSSGPRRRVRGLEVLPPLIAVAIALVGTSAEARMCLPHLFEEGQRLHAVEGPSLFDLSLIFGQHEICRRPQSQPQERNIALFGNSAVYGMHVSAAETFAGLLNAHWQASATPLHMYNLGYVASYLMKDALIVRKSLEYEPDVILFGITQADFLHMAPIPWPETTVQFFAMNDGGIDRMAEEGAAGLGELVERYRERDEHRDGLGQQWARLREAGSYLRLAARGYAPVLVNRWLLSPEDGPVPPPDREVVPRLRGSLRYKCQKVLDDFENNFGDSWSSWNILAYLEQVQRESGVDIIVFDLPIQHNPIGACYNGRYPTQANAQFRSWLQTETDARGLEFWDLHDLLPSEQFDDTIHPSKSGHIGIANELARRIEAHLRTRPMRNPNDPRRSP